MSRVYKNKQGYLALDSDMYGSRKRLSTGKKYDARLKNWYEKNFEDEYKKIYEIKFKIKSDSTLTFKEYGIEVLDATRKRRTAKSQQTAVRKFYVLCDFFGEFDLKNITRLKCAQWQSEQLEELAPKTVTDYRSILYTVLDFAMEDGIISKNPLSKLDSPKRAKDGKKTALEEKRTPVYYSASQLMTIINNAKGAHKNLYQFAAFGGMRGGELIALRWENVDFEKNKIKISESVLDYLISTPKNGKTRVIDMLPPAKEALLAQRKRTGLSEYVFLTQYGKRYKNPDSISDHMKKLTSSINLEPGTLHDLRRSCNTMLKQMGYPSDYVLQFIGHENEKVNREHYTGSIRINIADFNARFKYANA